MSSKLDQVIKDIGDLTAGERQDVLEALTKLIEDEAQEEAAILEAAAARGVHIDLPTGAVTDEEFDRFEPITVKGEPVSETILRDRR